MNQFRHADKINYKLYTENIDAVRELMDVIDNKFSDMTVDIVIYEEMSQGV